METRANNVWVGVVTLLLVAAVAAGFLLLARFSAESQKEYDILFQQSVAGLANGSEVTFAGVPVGQVAEIVLWKQDPEYVRVRIRVKHDVPILIGTTATIQGSFTGVSTILLDGARIGAPPITCESTACPDGVPLIPPKPGGLGELLANAPLLLERLATLTERMTAVLSEDNQSQIAGILSNTNTITRQFADTAPQVERTLAELQVTLRQSSEALDAFEKVMASTDQLLNSDGQALAVQLRTTLGSANDAAKSLSATLEETRPAARQLSETTLPAAEATLRDLKATSKALRAVTERLESEGAGSLLGSPALPDYKKK